LIPSRRLPVVKARREELLRKGINRVLIVDGIFDEVRRRDDQRAEEDQGRSKEQRARGRSALRKRASFASAIEARKNSVQAATAREGGHGDHGVDRLVLRKNM